MNLHMRLLAAFGSVLVSAARMDQRACVDALAGALRDLHQTPDLTPGEGAWMAAEVQHHAVGAAAAVVDLRQGSGDPDDALERLLSCTRDALACACGRMP